MHRGLEAEGRVDEFGLPTFPSRRFVSAGGLTVAHEGLLEYELVDIEGGPSDRRAKTMAVTLLRSTGMLSRLGMAYRPLPAGPLTPVEGLQLRGRTIEARYALCTGCDDPYAMVDDAFRSPRGASTRPGAGGAPPRRARSRSRGPRSPPCAARPACSRSASSTRPPRTTTVKVGARSGWLVDLRGRTVEPVDGSFDLRPFGIATFRTAG